MTWILHFFWRSVWMLLSAMPSMFGRLQTRRERILGRMLLISVFVGGYEDQAEDHVWDQGEYKLISSGNNISVSFHWRYEVLVKSYGNVAIGKKKSEETNICVIQSCWKYLSCIYVFQGSICNDYIVAMCIDPTCAMCQMDRELNNIGLWVVSHLISVCVPSQLDGCMRNLNRFKFVAFDLILK